MSWTWSLTKALRCLPDSTWSPNVPIWPHTVPANTQEEPLEKHYVSSRSRSQKGVLVFLARDATQRVLCYARAGITKAQQPGEILRFVKFWKQHTGHLPAELVFDSRLTTYGH